MSYCIYFFSYKNCSHNNPDIISNKFFLSIQYNKCWPLWLKTTWTTGSLWVCEVGNRFYSEICTHKSHTKTSTHRHTHTHVHAFFLYGKPLCRWEGDYSSQNTSWTAAKGGHLTGKLSMLASQEDQKEERTHSWFSVHAENIRKLVIWVIIEHTGGQLLK